MNDVELALVDLIERCRSLKVPSTELDEMVALTKAGEPGVACENLCTQLVEYGVAVPASVVDGLKRVADSMGICAGYVERLKPVRGSRP